MTFPSNVFTSEKSLSLMGAALCVGRTHRTGRTVPVVTVGDSFLPIRDKIVAADTPVGVSDVQAAIVRGDRQMADDVVERQGDTVRPCVLPGMNGTESATIGEQRPPEIGRTAYPQDSVVWCIYSMQNLTCSPIGDDRLSCHRIQQQRAIEPVNRIPSRDSATEQDRRSCRGDI